VTFTTNFRIATSGWLPSACRCGSRSCAMSRGPQARCRRVAANGTPQAPPVQREREVVDPIPTPSRRATRRGKGSRPVTIRGRSCVEPRCYSIVMCPPVSDTVGNAVRPIVSVSPCVVAVTLNGTPFRGAVPSHVEDAESGEGLGAEEDWYRPRNFPFGANGAKPFAGCCTFRIRMAAQRIARETVERVIS
jgi:hypothetical protein